MFDGKWRAVVDRGLTPIGASLRRAGVSADIVTITGITMATIASVTISMGYLNLKIGFLFLILTGIPDALDGAVAKASGASSRRGAYFDSVSDRLTDILLFGGVAWYLDSETTDSRIVMLPVAVMCVAMLVSYQRAKAESLGYEAKGGLMERAERFIVLGFGLLFNELLVATLWIMLTLTSFTAIQRFRKVWRQASATHPKHTLRQPRSRRRFRRPRTTAQKHKRRRMEAMWRARMKHRAQTIEGNSPPPPPS